MAFPAEGVEATYRNNIDQVAQLLRRKHGQNYILYNLSNRPYDCAKFNGQVINWCGFPDHHPPPLPLLFKIVHSIHEWLSGSPENIAVIHCLAGKGRTGVIIACFFAYCGFFPNAEQGLNFFSYRRSINCWGVTGPSQLRYIDYYDSILQDKSIPHMNTMHLRRIHFGPMPRFAIGGGEKGCTPFFEIYQLQREKFLLYSSERSDGEMTSFDLSTKRGTILASCMVQGDILIQFYHITPMHSSEPMFHLVFNVGMVHGGRVSFEKGDLEKAEKDARFPNSFLLELELEPCGEREFNLRPEQKEVQLSLFMKRPPSYSSDGSICFSGSSERLISRMKISRDIGDPTSGVYSVKGGWLYKRGHTVRNWKRRWFTLRSSCLSYYKSPRDLKCVGEIPFSSIEGVSPVSDEEWPYCFEVSTSRAPFLISAGSMRICHDWMNALLFAITQQRGQFAAQVSLGSLHVKLLETNEIRYHGGLCCSVSLGSQTEIVLAKANTTGGDQLHAAQFGEGFDFFVGDPNASLGIVIWENDWALSRNTFLAELFIPLPLLKNTVPTEYWYTLQSLSDAARYSPEIQLRVEFTYKPSPLSEETILAETDLLFPPEQRSARLGGVAPPSRRQLVDLAKQMNVHGRVPVESDITAEPKVATRRQLPGFGAKKRDNFLPAKHPGPKMSQSLIGVRAQTFAGPMHQSGPLSLNKIDPLSTTISAGLSRYFRAGSMQISCMQYVLPFLWLGDASGAIHIFNHHIGERTITLIDESHSGRIHDIQRVGDHVWCSSDDTISIWDLVCSLLCLTFGRKTHCFAERQLEGENWCLAWRPRECACKRGVG